MKDRSEAVLNDIARHVHEKLRAFVKSIGEPELPPWESAPDWMKSSTIDGVVTFINNPNMKASDSHDTWMNEKLRTGWKYGEVKDADKKTHPLMIPYEKLPEDQRKKDQIFIDSCKERLFG